MLFSSVGAMDPEGVHNEGASSSNSLESLLTEAVKAAMVPTATSILTFIPSATSTLSLTSRNTSLAAYSEDIVDVVDTSLLINAFKETLDPIIGKLVNIATRGGVKEDNWCPRMLSNAEGWINDVWKRYHKIIEELYDIEEKCAYPSRLLFLMLYSRTHNIAIVEERYAPGTFSNFNSDQLHQEGITPEIAVGMSSVTMDQRINVNLDARPKNRKRKQATRMQRLLTLLKESPEGTSRFISLCDYNNFTIL